MVQGCGITTFWLFPIDLRKVRPVDKVFGVQVPRTWIDDLGPLPLVLVRLYALSQPLLVFLGQP